MAFVPSKVLIGIAPSVATTCLFRVCVVNSHTARISYQAANERGSTMSGSIPSDVQPWGAMRPPPIGRALQLAVAAGLGHGKAKQLIAWSWRRLCGEQPVDVVVRDVTYRLDFRDNAPANKILFASRYDVRELNYLHRENINGGAFVDIGANIGYYSLDVASRGTRVLAIEPNPVVFERLKFNIEANGMGSLVTAVPFCVAETGRHKLSFNEDCYGTGSLIAVHGGSRQIEVNGDTLLNLLDRYQITQVASLKIDIEGAEDLALAPFFEAAPRRLWPRCAVVEHSHRPLWRRDLIQLMVDKGYQIISRRNANTILSRSGLR